MKRGLRTPALLILGLVLCAAAGFGQDASPAERLRQQCDKNLNSIYQLLLRVLAPARQTSLRNAQRAWLEYRDKNSAVLRLLGANHRYTDDQVIQAETYELVTRLDEMRRLTSPVSPTAEDPQTAFARTDADLNDAYKQLNAQLDDPGRKQLREAQRAWIAFRDLEAKSASISSLPDGGIAAARLATEYRAAALRGYVAGATMPLPGAPASAPARVVQKPLFSTPARTEPTPEPGVPDPFATAR